MIEIFLSRPTMIEEKFQSGLQGFLNILKNLEFNPRTLGASDYPNKAPLDEVILLMSKCKGAIVLGYPQIYSSNSIIKGTKTKEKIILPTEWNHIEASLAYSKKLPLLIIHQLGIQRGVFDHGALNCFIYGIDLSTENWAIKENITGALKKWKDEVKNYKPFVNQLKSDESNPICPNCSTNEKKFYLSPIGAIFAREMNANYECSKCGFTKMVNK